MHFSWKGGGRRGDYFSKKEKTERNQFGRRRRDFGGGGDQPERGATSPSGLRILPSTRGRLSLIEKDGSKMSI